MSDHYFKHCVLFKNVLFKQIDIPISKNQAMQILNHTYKKPNKIHKQVDILISKNQALQMLYLKHHAYKSLWIKNLTKSAKN